jgi:hypothetical protein
MLIPTAYAECMPSAKSCTLYTCVEQSKRCGPDGFLIDTAYKYCQNFQSLDNRLSHKGNLWLTKTRKCLQQKLKQKLHLSCHDLEDASIKDHVNCYVDNGYCKLKLTDKLRVFGLIKNELFHTPTYILKNLAAMMLQGCI